MERLKQAYLALPPRLRARVPIGLEDWVRTDLLPRFRATGPAAVLEAKLWGGFFFIITILRLHFPCIDAILPQVPAEG